MLIKKFLYVTLRLIYSKLLTVCVRLARSTTWTGDKCKEDQVAISNIGNLQSNITAGGMTIEQMPHYKYLGS